MPTSARLFVYEGLRETTRTTKKNREIHMIPCERERAQTQDFINVMIRSNIYFFFSLSSACSAMHLLSSNSSSHANFRLVPGVYSVYLVLGSLHRLRPASSLRAHPQIEDDDRRGDVHSKFGATQLGRQSAHLLPIFYTSLSQSQVKYSRLNVFKFNYYLIQKFEILFVKVDTRGGGERR